MSQLHDNANKITNAFARLTATKDAVIAAGFARMMRFGLEALLDAHDFQGDYSHAIAERETLGWMIFHDGREVASGAQDRGPLEGSVRLQLEYLGSGVTSGWVGFLMSDMVFNWYRVDYEIAWLHYSKDEIISNFNRFFTPVTR